MSEEIVRSSAGNVFDRIFTSQQSNVGIIIVEVDPNLDEGSGSDHFSENKALSQVEFCVAIRKSVNGMEIFNLVIENLAKGKLIICMKLIEFEFELFK